MKQRSIFSVKLSILQFSILLSTKIVAMATKCYKKGQKSSLGKDKWNNCQNVWKVAGL